MKNYQKITTGSFAYLIAVANIFEDTMPVLVGIGLALSVLIILFGGFWWVSDIIRNDFELIERISNWLDK